MKNNPNKDYMERLLSAVVDPLYPLFSEYSGKVVGDQTTKNIFRDRYQKSNPEAQQLANLMAYRLSNDPEFKELDLGNNESLTAANELREAIKTFKDYDLHNKKINNTSFPQNALQNAQATFQRYGFPSPLNNNNKVNKEVLSDEAIRDNLQNLASTRQSFTKMPDYFGLIANPQPDLANTNRNSSMRFNMLHPEANNSNRLINTFNHEITHQGDYDPDTGEYNSERAIKGKLQKSLGNQDEKRLFEPIGNIIGDPTLKHRIQSDPANTNNIRSAEIIAHMVPQFSAPWTYPQEENVRKVAHKLSKVAYHNLTNDNKFVSKLPRTPVLNNGQQVFESFKYNGQQVPKYHFGEFEPTIQNIRNKIDFLSKKNTPTVQNEKTIDWDSLNKKNNQDITLSMPQPTPKVTKSNFKLSPPPRFIQQDQQQVPQYGTGINAEVSSNPISSQPTGRPPDYLEMFDKIHSKNNNNNQLDLNNSSNQTGINSFGQQQQNIQNQQLGIIGYQPQNLGVDINTDDEDWRDQPVTSPVNKYSNKQLMNSVDVPVNVPQLKKGGSVHSTKHLLAQAAALNQLMARSQPPIRPLPQEKYTLQDLIRIQRYLDSIS